MPAPWAVASSAMMAGPEVVLALIVSTPVIRAQESSFAMVNPVAFVPTLRISPWLEPAA